MVNLVQIGYTLLDAGAISSEFDGNRKVAKAWHQRQKDRGVKLILTWFEPRKRWKKYHDRKVWYFKHPNSAEGYEAAVAEYHSRRHQEKETRPLGPEYCHHIEQLDKCCEWYERFGTPVSEGRIDEDGIRDEVFELRRRLVETMETSDELPLISYFMPNGDSLAKQQFLARFFPKERLRTRINPARSTHASGP